jgi:hypothetical protein
MRACTHAQTDVATSSIILALITAKQRGNRESDTESACSERGFQETRGQERPGQEGPRGLLLTSSTFPEADRDDRFKACASLGPELNSTKANKEPQAMAGR